MTPERWRQIAAIFDAAVAQPPEDRVTWVAGACEGDEDLRREVEALLQAHDTAGDFLEQPAEMPADDEDAGLSPGSQLGAYRILEEIGRGGMGIVYLAEDARLGRRVALKSLPEALTLDEGLRARLRREARAAATISHPAVATVYALEEEGEQLFIVSEYVPGETLRQLIDRGPLEATQARAIAIQVARALCAAHDAGVVHRDLKPENVLITPDGAVKVVDFGVAHVEAPEATRLTRAGALLGTPAYMAPEQLIGGPVDARADIYAFGVMLSEMLTGQHPLRTPRATPAQLPALLSSIVARSLQPDAAARFASARELVAALETSGANGNVRSGADALAVLAAAGPDGQGAAADGRLEDLSPRRPSDAGGDARLLTATARGDADDVPLRGATIRAHGHGALWWWEFHQAITAVIYWLMMIPAWAARGVVGGTGGRAFFIVALSAVVVAANLRLHLWFTSRFYPEELRWVRRRTGRFIRIADWTLAVALSAAGIYIGDADSPLSALLISFAIGAAVAFLFIEPVTTRAAFKATTRHG